MSSPHHSRALAIVLSVVPGWGHVYLGREAIGLAIFTLEAVSFFLLLNLVLVYHGGHRGLLVRGSAACLLFFWLLSVADVWRRTSPRGRRRMEEEKARLLRGGMIAYLRNDLRGAEEAFRACLRLDHQEVEALVRLGVVAARRGAARAARRWLRRARRLDLEEKWSWEIERELRGLKARALAGAGAVPPAAPPGGRGLAASTRGRAAAVSRAPGAEVAPGGKAGPAEPAEAAPASDEKVDLKS